MNVVTVAQRLEPSLRDLPPRLRRRTWEIGRSPSFLQPLSGTSLS